MNVCPGKKEMADHLAGALPVDASKKISEHLRECICCRRDYGEMRAVVDDLKDAPGEFTSHHLVEEIGMKIRSGNIAKPDLYPQYWYRSIKNWGVVGGMIAATVLGIVIGSGVFRDSPSGADLVGYVGSRGGNATADRWVSVVLFQRNRSSSEYTLVTRRITSGNPIAVTYEDRSRSSHRYLMVFGVDSKKQIFWLYPGYTDPSKNPTSIEITTNGKRVSLPDEVVHSYAPGRMRFFGLFTDTPLNVLDVEQNIRKQLDKVGSLSQLKRLSSIKGGQWSIEVEVMASEVPQGGS
jgi:hypothetical protein